MKMTRTMIVRRTMAMTMIIAMFIDSAMASSTFNGISACSTRITVVYQWYISLFNK